MSTQDLQARTERFVDWLEAKRRAAGLTQDQLAKYAGISHSYYSKIVTSWRYSDTPDHKRKRYVGPPDTDLFEKILTGLAGRLGESAVEDGYRILNPPSCPIGITYTDEALIKLLLRVQRLTPEKRRLVVELIDHLE
jgi:hypothetical protein